MTEEIIYQNQLSQLGEWEIFLWAIALGAVLGAVYDLLRIFHALFPHGKILLFAEDFLYVLLCGISLYIFCTAVVGEIRCYCSVGMIIGWLCERFLLGNFVVGGVRKVSSAFRRKIIHPFVDFITKILSRVKVQFVKNAKISKNEKNPQKVLES